MTTDELRRAMRLGDKPGAVLALLAASRPLRTDSAAQCDDRAWDVPRGENTL